MKLYKFSGILLFAFVLLIGCGSVHEKKQVGAAESEPAVQEWFDYYNYVEGGWDDEQEISLDAFPGVSFRWTNENLDAVIGDEIIPLYSGMPIWSVYFTDLTGDGLPELCSTVSVGSGVIDERIIIYDYANGVSYMLEDRGNYDYNLSQQNQQLMVTKKRYNSKEVMETKRLSFEEETIQLVSTEGNSISFKAKEEAAVEGMEEKLDTGYLEEVKPVALDTLLNSDNPAADFLGADGVELNYADEIRLVFHSFAGLFVCERDSEGWKLVSSVDLKPLGADMTQGDEASLILAQKDQILIMPKHYGENQENTITYRYRYSESNLEQIEEVPEQEDPALSWSYSREGMEISEKIYEAIGQGEWFISNPYPIRESDSRQYGFIAVGPEGFASLQFGRYFEKSDKVVLEPIESRTYVNRMNEGVKNYVEAGRQQPAMTIMRAEKE